MNWSLVYKVVKPITLSRSTVSIVPFFPSTLDHLFLLSSYHIHTMELTFVTDLGDTFVVDIDPNMELEDVMALLEAEVIHPGLKAAVPC